MIAITIRSSIRVKKQFAGLVCFFISSPFSMGFIVLVVVRRTCGFSTFPAMMPVLSYGLPADLPSSGVRNLFVNDSRNFPLRYCSFLCRQVEVPVPDVSDQRRCQEEEMRPFPLSRVKTEHAAVFRRIRAPASHSHERSGIQSVDSIRFVFFISILTSSFLFSDKH